MSKPAKNILFVVQGEGRGHMTQAIALQNMLLNEGFNICSVLIGKSPRREIPSFFYEQIKAPVIAFDSPNFRLDKKGKSINVISTITFNLLKLPTFKKSLNLIKEQIKIYKPDMIINFYDPLIGLYYLLNKVKIPLVCVAHQYVYHHPEFKFPKGHRLERKAIQFHTWLTAAKAKKKLALSFYPLLNDSSKSLFITPPLLRKEVFEQDVKENPYLLIYLLNSGYTEEIIKWHKKNKDRNLELHCFTDRNDIEDMLCYDEKLYFHRINGAKFLKMMAEAIGLISTAGFESVCEAMYLGKPVLMVPVEGHFEQYCNSRDAFKAGAGIYSDNFDISKFIEYIPKHLSTAEFKKWVDSTSSDALEQIKETFVKDSL